MSFRRSGPQKKNPWVAMGRKRRGPSSPFLSLPVDLQQTILSYLTPQELSITSETSRHLYVLSNSSTVWKSLFHKSYYNSINYLEQCTSSPSSVSAKTVYQRLHKASQVLNGDTRPAVFSTRIPHTHMQCAFMSSSARPDGSTYIATGSYDKTCVLTEYRQGELKTKKVFRGHRAGVRAILMSVNYLVTSSFDGSIRIHDISDAGMEVDDSVYETKGDDPPLSPIHPPLEVAPLPFEHAVESSMNVSDLALTLSGSSANPSSRSRSSRSKRRGSKSRGSKKSKKKVGSSSNSSSLPAPPRPPPPNSPISVGESAHALRSSFGKVLAVINGPKDGDDCLLGPTPSSPRTPRKIKPPTEKDPDVLADTYPSGLYVLEEKNALVTTWNDESIRIYALTSGGLILKISNCHGPPAPGDDEDSMALWNVFAAPNSLVQPLAPTLMGAYVHKNPPSAATEPTSLYGVTARKDVVRLWNLTVGAMIMEYRLTGEVEEIGVMFPPKWFPRSNSMADEEYKPPPVGSSWIEPGKRWPAFPPPPQPASSSPSSSSPPQSPQSQAPQQQQQPPALPPTPILPVLVGTGQPPPNDPANPPPDASARGAVVISPNGNPLGVGVASDVVPVDVINSQEPMPIEDQILVIIAVKDAVSVSIHRTYESSPTHFLPRSYDLIPGNNSDLPPTIEKIKSVDTFENIVSLAGERGTVAFYNAFTGEQVALIQDGEGVNTQQAADFVVFNHDVAVVGSRQHNLIRMYSLPSGTRIMDFNHRASAFTRPEGMDVAYSLTDTGLALISTHTGDGKDEISFVDFTSHYDAPKMPWRDRENAPWILYDDVYWSYVWTALFLCSWSLALHVKLTLSIYDPLWSLVNIPLILFGFSVMMNFKISLLRDAPKDPGYNSPAKVKRRKFFYQTTALLLIVGPTALSLKTDFFLNNTAFLWTYAMAPWLLFCLLISAAVISRGFNGVRQWRRGVEFSIIHSSIWLCWFIYVSCLSACAVLVTLWADNWVPGLTLSSLLLPLRISSLPGLYIIAGLLFSIIYGWREEWFPTWLREKITVAEWEWDEDANDRYFFRLVALMSFSVYIMPAIQDVLINNLAPALADWEDVAGLVVFTSFALALPVVVFGGLRAREIDSGLDREDKAIELVSSSALKYDDPVAHLNESIQQLNGQSSALATLQALIAQLDAADLVLVDNDEEPIIPVPMALIDIDDDEDGLGDDDPDLEQALATAAANANANAAVPGGGGGGGPAALAAPPPPAPAQAMQPPTPDQFNMAMEMIAMGIPAEEIQANLPPGVHIPQLQNQM